MDKLPFRVITSITNEFIIVEIFIAEDFSLLDFFGKFKLDWTGKIFKIFSSFEIGCKRSSAVELFKILPKEVLSLEFSSWNVNRDDGFLSSNRLLTKFLENSEINCLGGISISNSTICMLGGEKYRKLRESVTRLTNIQVDGDLVNETFKNLRNFSHVRYLSLQWYNITSSQKHIEDLEMTELRSFSCDNLLDCITFKKQRKLEEVSIAQSSVKNIQLFNMSLNFNIKRFSIIFSNLENDFYRIFSLPNIEEILMYYCKFNTLFLNNVRPNENSKLRKLSLPGSEWKEKDSRPFFLTLTKLKNLKNLHLYKARGFNELFHVMKENECSWTGITINLQNVEDIESEVLGFFDGMKYVIFEV